MASDRSEELALIESSDWRGPPRLASQPIFYPVLNDVYATRIARDWNVPASGSGYVTRFEVRKSFLDNYEVHQVGGETILEYWIRLRTCRPSTRTSSAGSRWPPSTTNHADSRHERRFRRCMAMNNHAARFGRAANDGPWQDMLER